MSEPVVTDQFSIQVFWVFLQSYSSEATTVEPWFTNLICSISLENIGIFMFMWYRLLWLCLLPEVEFANKKICETITNYLQTKAFGEQCNVELVITVLLFFIYFPGHSQYS